MQTSWRQLGSWCAGRQIDSIKALLTSVLDFLTYCFHEGYECNTIGGFRLAILAHHDPIEGFAAVAQHPRVSVILSGTFKKRPPREECS